MLRGGLGRCAADGLGDEAACEIFQGPTAGFSNAPAARGTAMAAAALSWAPVP
ncbi:hypothetical protein XCR_2684 [Xanthomonas campestris pv. raphani 756C]|nr:hypothetical protein XCR_2684 [Xanthomonas campestris pv. raphani 756C]